jgi:hypothetical protein
MSMTFHKFYLLATLSLGVAACGQKSQNPAPEQSPQADDSNSPNDSTTDFLASYRGDFEARTEGEFLRINDDGSYEWNMRRQITNPRANRAQAIFCNYTVEGKITKVAPRRMRNRSRSASDTGYVIVMNRQSIELDRNGRRGRQHDRANSLCESFVRRSQARLRREESLTRYAELDSSGDSIRFRRIQQRGNQGPGLEEQDLRDELFTRR